MANKLLANKQRQNDDDERGLLALREWACWIRDFPYRFFLLVFCFFAGGKWHLSDSCSCFCSLFSSPSIRACFCSIWTRKKQWFMKELSNARLNKFKPNKGTTPQGGTAIEWWWSHKSERFSALRSGQFLEKYLEKYTCSWDFN